MKTKHSIKKSLISKIPIIFAPIVLSVLFFLLPLKSEAASGGRIGGGQFSAPSAPRVRSYGGSGYGIPRGYGGGYGSRYGGGFGFPFVLPFFGFGGGLFGFFVLMTITGLIVNAIRGSTFQGNDSNNIKNNNQFSDQPKNITLIQAQIGLLASAKQIQKDLRNLAKESDTKTSSGLQRVLSETTLSLLRNSDLWAYSNLEIGKVPFNSAESTFNRLSLIERGKLSGETTFNFSGENISPQTDSTKAGEADSINEYIAVTIIVASKGNFLSKQSTGSEQLREELRLLGSISSREIIALEVIWQPDGEGDVLTAEELVTNYPNLKHL